MPEPASPWLNPSESTAGQKGLRRGSRKRMNPLTRNCRFLLVLGNTFQTSNTSALGCLSFGYDSGRDSITAENIGDVTSHKVTVVSDTYQSLRLSRMMRTCGGFAQGSCVNGVLRIRDTDEIRSV